MSIDTDVVCAGDIMVECILRMPSLPAADTTLVLDSAIQELGGPAFNICWYLSQLGRRPQLVGPFGLRNRPLITEALCSCQLEQIGLIPIEGDTDLLIALLTDNHHHSIYLRTRLPDGIGPEIVARCGQPRVLILTGSRHCAIRKAFLVLADAFRGELLAFNPSYAIYEYDSTDLFQLLSKAHVAILNRQEAEYACKALALEDISQLAKDSSGSLIVTLGHKGMRMYRRKDMLEIGSYATASSNPVGAGDGLFAGFLHEALTGASLPDAARFGSVLAAYVVESSQVRIQISGSQIRRRLAEHS